MWIAEELYNNNITGYIKAYQGSTLVWNKNMIQYLYIQSNAETSTVTLANNQKTRQWDINYSYDSVNWYSFTTGMTLTIRQNEAVLFKGINDPSLMNLVNGWITDSSAVGGKRPSGYYSGITIDGNVNIGGKVNSLIAGDYVDNISSYDDDYVFAGLFNNCSAITHVNKFILPPIQGRGLYYALFKDCINLTDVPSNLGNGFFYGAPYMFENCSALTYADIILASSTTTDANCQGMFQNCTSLTKAPTLMMSDGNFERMFENCRNLNEITCYIPYPSDPSDYDKFSYFAWNVSGSGTFYNYSNTTWEQNYQRPISGGYETFTKGYPIGWTVVEDIPLQSISISGETTVTATATYTVNYTPSNTTETGVTWSIVSGSQYASIDSSTGVLTAINGASGDTVVIRATSIVHSDITADKTLSVSYPSIDFTKKNWWHGTYQFELPTRWNNNYYLEFDYYGTVTANTSTAIIVQTNTSPMEVRLNQRGFFFDIHYPNSTTNATVKSTDYDKRIMKSSGINTAYDGRKCTMRLCCGTTGRAKIVDISGTTILDQTTSVASQNYCTTKDYVFKFVAPYTPVPDWHSSDVRIYDSNNTLIHNFQLYQNPNSNNEYQYYDRITETWYPNINSSGVITDVTTTDR